MYPLRTQPTPSITKADGRTVGLVLHARVAQSAERALDKRKVAGSIPAPGTPLNRTA